MILNCYNTKVYQLHIEKKILQVGSDHRFSFKLIITVNRSHSYINKRTLNFLRLFLGPFASINREGTVDSLKEGERAG